MQKDILTCVHKYLNSNLRPVVRIWHYPCLFLFPLLGAKSKLKTLVFKLFLMSDRQSELLHRKGSRDTQNWICNISMLKCLSINETFVICFVKLCKCIIPNVSNNVQSPKRSQIWCRVTVCFIWLPVAITWPNATWIKLHYIVTPCLSPMDHHHQRRLLRGHLLFALFLTDRSLLKEMRYWVFKTEAWTLAQSL